MMNPKSSVEFIKNSRTLGSGIISSRRLTHIGEEVNRWQALILIQD
jgi:hypothetical protein